MSEQAEKLFQEEKNAQMGATYEETFLNRVLLLPAKLLSALGGVDGVFQQCS